MTNRYLIDGLKSCEMCPHRCKVNRNENQLGRCKAGAKIKIALASSHMYEEPCISGTNGSGTIFFSNCNLKCKFCQNYEISQMRKRRRDIYRKIGRGIYRTTGKKCT